MGRSKAAIPPSIFVPSGTHYLIVLSLSAMSKYEVHSGAQCRCTPGLRIWIDLEESVDSMGPNNTLSFNLLSTKLTKLSGRENLCICQYSSFTVRPSFPVARPHEPIKALREKSHLGTIFATAPSQTQARSGYFNLHSSSKQVKHWPRRFCTQFIKEGLKINSLTSAQSWGGPPAQLPLSLTHLTPNTY